MVRNVHSPAFNFLVSAEIFCLCLLRKSQKLGGGGGGCKNQREVDSLFVAKQEQTLFRDLRQAYYRDKRELLKCSSGYAGCIHTHTHWCCTIGEKLCSRRRRTTTTLLPSMTWVLPHLRKPLLDPDLPRTACAHRRTSRNRPQRRLGRSRGERRHCPGSHGCTTGSWDSPGKSRGSRLQRVQPPGRQSSLPRTFPEHYMANLESKTWCINVLKSFCS